ncbi:MAG: type II toxin-antitoxin system Phd/YefM family antitoxin [Nostoc sp. DedVER02]|uniref:type II toxin-antitoxin system Phd/YefM family antitoxin n=1 Tax=unclassified Nostoc TaxID=2593658 RepID=UPI002AD3381A|nr:MULTISPECIES: type II toxin-antitoxin system Phd/YefM family antitoxin [unclassified Nostoc]MDZ7986741.1 type II toxin-antitoxin system Phd/YefM family antitoxin [Nostoc sp. DedVER02]MDZ8115643.1 type II toxin-antitoxin system Phd/YefM family antitoxin [Nostoc sp. DedVER01b]
MSNKTNYTEACNNFEKIYEEAISNREPVVVTHEGAESVSVIPTAELNSIIETAYLFQSPENAARLLDALQRVKAKTNKELLKRAIVEVLQEQKEVLYDLLAEIMEDIALERAIKEGENTETVSREAIFKILDRKG